MGTSLIDAAANELPFIIQPRQVVIAPQSMFSLIAPLLTSMIFLIVFSSENLPGHVVAGDLTGKRAAAQTLERKREKRSGASLTADVTP